MNSNEWAGLSVEMPKDRTTFDPDDMPNWLASLWPRQEFGTSLLTVFDAPMDLPSQFIRQVLAVECGCPSDWEWAENPFLERVSTFVDKVRKMGPALDTG